MTELSFHILFLTLDGSTILLLCWIRIWVIFKVIPMFSGELLPALARNIITISISLALIPMVSESMTDATDRDFFWFVMIVGKEVFIGLVIGQTISLVFWAIGGIGFFIDNQRGASMASTMNPMLGDQTSPLGTLFTQIVITILFVSGGMLALLDGIYTSYVIWPPVTFFPILDINNVSFFLNQFDDLMMVILLLGGPLVGCMFLAEFGLGMVGRFAPQLNVFFLAMPIKSGVAFAVLLVYLPTLLVIMNDRFLALRYITDLLDPVFR